MWRRLRALRAWPRLGTSTGGYADQADTPRHEGVSGESRQLRVVSVEHALGSVQLPGHVLGVVADRPVRELECHVRDVRPQQVRLDERLHPVPDLLAGTVEVEC